MQIEREKFLALTARLAGFWPTEACAAVLGARAGDPRAAASPPAPTGPSPGGLAGSATCAKLRG
jgi:hypothetical protein